VGKEEEEDGCKIELLDPENETITLTPVTKQKQKSYPTDNDSDTDTETETEKTSHQQLILYKTPQSVLMQPFEDEQNRVFKEYLQQRDDLIFLNSPKLSIKLPPKISASNYNRSYHDDEDDNEEVEEIPIRRSPRIVELTEDEFEDEEDGVSPTVELPPDDQSTFNQNSQFNNNYNTSNEGSNSVQQFPSMTYHAPYPSSLQIEELKNDEAYIEAQLESMDLD